MTPRGKRVTHGFHSHWCVLLEYHLKRRRLNVSNFAASVGRSQQVVHTYISGRARPPLELVAEWAAVLRLTPAEQTQFVQAAFEVHTPEVIWRRLMELEHGAERRALSNASQEILAELAARQKAVAELVSILQDLEALFLLRTVHHSKFAAEKHRLTHLVRVAIEKHAKPPPPASPPEA